MSTPLSRRRFLGAAALGGATIASSLSLPGPLEQLGRLGLPSAFQPRRLWAGEGSPPPVEIHKVFLAKPIPTWPKPDLDVRAEMARLDGYMKEAEETLENVRFVGGELLRVPADCDGLLATPDDSAGYLAFNLTSTVGHLLSRLVDSGKPTVLYSQPYSGHDWSAIPSMQRAGKKVIVLATSDGREVAEAARILRVGPLLRGSRILCLSGGKLPDEQISRFKTRVGIDLVSVDAARLNTAYAEVDPALAAADADAWIRGAVRVVEASREDIEKSSRLFLAMKQLLELEKAQAITINCLGLFAQKLLPAYPCLGFTRLNDLGFVGACEADVDSTLTMLVLGYAFGVPGFVSDPVIDTATNTVIHAHCVAPTKLDGPRGPVAPYLIRTHLEDGKGASLQVKMRLGQQITAAKLTELETFLVSTGTIIDNPDVDRGCRTKITTSVANARKILDGYSGGLHRVVCYGHRVQSLKHLCTLMGWKLVEEA